MTQPISPEARALLTAQDRERLTYFKWRFVLQADGFSAA